MELKQICKKAFIVDAAGSPLIMFKEESGGFALECASLR